jgi:hypothetical protein
MLDLLSAVRTRLSMLDENSFNALVDEIQTQGYDE